MEKNLALLGFKVEDVVTGFTGVLESVSFDLYGCIQAVVRPPMNDKGEKVNGEWFDLKRLVAVSDRPVMVVPTFEIVPGGTEKPARQSIPVR